MTGESTIRAIFLAAACLLCADRDATPAAQNPAGAEELVKRGLVALHYFEYEEANEAFRKAQALDSTSVLACWGEAMTYHQTLWRHENLAAGRSALARLSATPAARAARPRTRKEKMLLEAVDLLFGAGDADTRKRRYADAMGRLYDQEPDDPDVGSLYALALLGTMSRSLIGSMDAHEGHVDALAGSPTQARVAAILEKVLKAHPEHPGALHYLLHNDDDPAHAAQALDAARTLARLAPDASHALHMPAHIFLQLGLWGDAAASDAAAFKASDAWVARKHLALTLRNYHALAWLEYELLQQGRRREARATLGEIEPVVARTGDLTLLSDASSMRARYAVETEDWTLLAKADAFGNVNELFALGMSAARSGDAPRAERARQVLADKQRDEREGDLRPAIAIMERELAGLNAYAAGRRDEGMALLERAAAAERRLPAPLGLPAPLKPAPELLGELLLDAGRPTEAAAFFAQALERNANRSLSVLGLARAGAARGDRTTATQHYEQLLRNFSGADPDFPALREAREAVAARTRLASDTKQSSEVEAAVSLVAAAAAASVGVFLWRRRTRQRHAAQKKSPQTRAQRRKP